jgi:probable HAF family extracellular repeat protein
VHARQGSGNRWLRLIGVFLAALAAAAPCPGQCQYEVTVIEGPQCAFGPASMYACSLNDQGHIVGFFKCPTGYAEPFLWTPETGLIELPLPPDSYEAAAEDINEAGQIVGTATIASVGFRAFVYDKGQFTMLPPVIPDAGWCKGFGINNDATVVGYRSITEEVNPYNGYIWSAEDGFTDLGVMEGPHSSAVDISEDGVVVGWTGLMAATEEVFLREEGEVRLLGPIPGGVSSAPGDLNNREQVAGAGIIQVGLPRENRWRAFLWDRGCWTLIEPLPGHDRNTARALNDLSQVVGQSGEAERGFLWQKGVTCNLDELALLDPSCVIERAKAINNAGQIVADGYDWDYGDVSFLLAPIDRPAGDIDADCQVDVADLLFLLREWGKTDSLADINGDGIVNVADLLILLGDWGA